MSRERKRQSKTGTYSVGQVAELCGLTVRTLHHYEAIGLVTPERNARTGYRIYREPELLRLQQVLIHRELGLSLSRIGEILDTPEFDLSSALRSQRQRLNQRLHGLRAMVQAIDVALARLDDGPHKHASKEKRMNNEDTDLKELFDGFNPQQHEEEVEQQWGSTDAYVECSRRTRDYGREQWDAIQQESAAIYKGLTTLSDQDPSSDAAMQLAEQHRRHIERWFYPCSGRLHIGLADMYEADPRFAANIDRFGEGLTPFLAAAIRANAERVGNR